MKIKSGLFAIVITGLSLVAISCGSRNTDAAQLAANSCGQNPSVVLSEQNPFTAGPVEVFFAAPIESEWLQRATRRAQLAAQAAAQESFWQPLADSWGIAEAAARAVVQPQFGDSATDLRLSYAMVTKDSFCRIALVRIGTRLSSDQ